MTAWWKVYTAAVTVPDNPIQSKHSEWFPFLTLMWPLSQNVHVSEQNTEQPQGWGFMNVLNYPSPFTRNQSRRNLRTQGKENAMNVGTRYGVSYWSNWCGLIAKTHALFLLTHAKNILFTPLWIHISYQTKQDGKHLAKQTPTASTYGLRYTYGNGHMLSGLIREEPHRYFKAPDISW